MEEKLKELEKYIYNLINNTADNHADAIKIGKQIDATVQKARAEACKNVLIDDMYDDM